MKTKKMGKKLSLNKTTISTLANNQLNLVKGGQLIFESENMCLDTVYHTCVMSCSPNNCTAQTICIPCLETETCLPELPE